MTIQITAFSAYETAKRLKTRVDTALDIASEIRVQAVNQSLADTINMRANVSACEAVLDSIEKEVKGLRAYMKNLEDSARNAEMMDEKRREMGREIREGERDTAQQRGEVERD